MRWLVFKWWQLRFRLSGEHRYEYEKCHRCRIALRMIAAQSAYLKR
jgi:hypothetical protein